MNRVGILITSAIWICLALFIITFPNIFYLFLNDAGIRLMISWEGLSVLFILSFSFIFFWNIKLYFRAMYFYVFFVPFLCYSIYLYNLNLSPELIKLLMQTSFREAWELIAGYFIGFLFILVILTFIYFFIINQIRVKRVRFIYAFIISLLSAILFWGKIFQLKRDFKVNSLYGILNQYYPVSLFSSIIQTATVKKNDLSASKNFDFYPYLLKKTKGRKIYVLIIGESSRYDHWHINGYSRKTSPILDTMTHVISFTNAFSGAYFTYLSVPQIITRARPGYMDRQFKEKSILSIFKELGFKTIWISNQDKDYYTGSFTLHAENADIHIFPDDRIVPDIRNRYDGKYIPVIDSILRSSNSNIFLVFHTLGSHWNYADRYPDSFDIFQPSGKKINIQKPSIGLKNVIINSYDNSILYTDNIIASIIKLVDGFKSISFVFYLSDHGEDLFDNNPSKLLFHLYPSYQTLHIPLFVWTSSTYDSLFPGKVATLKKNNSILLSTNDVFYTIVGMSDIRFRLYDSTFDFSSPYFRQSHVFFTNDGKDKVLFK